jgi:hypothetical protein
MIWMAFSIAPEILTLAKMVKMDTAIPDFSVTRFELPITWPVVLVAATTSSENTTGFSI